MKKILFSLVLLVLLTACSGTFNGTRSPSPLIQHMSRSTVALMTVDDEDAARPYCTGVWVDKNTILTANHCVEAAYVMNLEKKIGKMDKEEQKKEIERLRGMTHAERKKIVVENTVIKYVVEGDTDQIGKEPYAMRLAKVIVVDPTHDLALVEAAGKNLPAHDIAYVADENPGIGERLRFIGQPKGLYWTYIEGVVAAYRLTLPEERSLTTEVNELDVEGPYLQVSAPVWYGNSGGGAYDQDGNLVGIASFLTGSPHSCFFIHRSVIKKLLREHRIQ